MINKTEEWLYKKAKEVNSELELQDLYTGKFSFGGRWVMDLLEDYHKEQLLLHDVSNWVTIESNIPPERCTEVMVKYKDGKKVVAFFDGDSRFYTLKDDYDISEQIVSWHKLP